MEILHVLALCTALASPGGTPSVLPPLAAATLGLDPGRTCISVLAVILPAAPRPRPDRGMGKVGTGRGMGKIGTGRGMGKVGTGRGMGKVGTGRGMAGVGSDRGETNAPGGQEPPGEGDGTGGGKDGGCTLSGGPGRGGEDDAVVRGTAFSAKASKTMKVFSPEVLPLVREGDREMEQKHYTVAGRWYFAAQQAERFQGRSSLRMAAALVGMGRFSDGATYLRIFLQEGGRIAPEDFKLPEDPELKKRLDTRLQGSPFNSDLLVSAAFYALSRGDGMEAATYLDRLEGLLPGHECIEPLRKSAARVDGGKGGAEDVKGEKGTE